MLKSFLLTLWNSLGTLLLAFAIAFAVWVSAVVAADPNEERDFPSPLTLQVKGLDPDLVLIGTLPDQVLLRLSAPLSLWDRLTSRAGTVDVFVDLTGLGPGQHPLGQPALPASLGQGRGLHRLRDRDIQEPAQGRGDA